MQRLRVDRGLDEVLAPMSGIDEQLGAALAPQFERFLARVKATGWIRADITGVDMGNLPFGVASSLRRGQDDSPS
jgi:hypothetical protein